MSSSPFNAVALNHILFDEGANRDRHVLPEEGEGGLPRLLPSRVRVWHTSRMVVIGMEVLPDEGPSQVYGITIESPPTPLNIYTAYRVMTALGKISSGILKGVGYTLNPKKYTNLAGSLPLLIEAMGQDTYDQIPSLRPPNFIQIMDFFEVHRIAWSREGMTEEIAAGKFPYDSSFGKYGVETPVQMEQRREEQKKFLEPLLPHIIAFSEVHQQPANGDIMLAALEFMSFPNSSIENLVTISILFAEMMLCFNASVRIPFDNKDHWIIAMKGVSKKQLIAFLLQRFPAYSAEEHEERIGKMIELIQAHVKER